MMPSMRDKIAERLIGHMEAFSALGRRPFPLSPSTAEWGDYSATEQATARFAADAVLDALMEPSDGMMLAGIDAESYRSLGQLKVKRVWGEMILAAKEGK